VAPADGDRGHCYSGELAAGPGQHARAGALVGPMGGAQVARRPWEQARRRAQRGSANGERRSSGRWQGRVHERGAARDGFIASPPRVEEREGGRGDPAGVSGCGRLNRRIARRGPDVHVRRVRHATGRGFSKRLGCVRTSGARPAWGGPGRRGAVAAM
jgi:hypothetical protein